MPTDPTAPSKNAMAAATKLAFGHRDDPMWTIGAATIIDAAFAAERAAADALVEACDRLRDLVCEEPNGETSYDLTPDFNERYYALRDALAAYKKTRGVQ